MAIKEKGTVFFDRLVSEIKKKADQIPFWNGLLVLLLFSLAVLIGCNPQARGFALPEGDAEAGKLAFVELKCDQCHSIGKIAFTGGAEETEVRLGGEVSKIKTYGELLTSVINPSHKISASYLKEKVTEGEESKMKTYNDFMTVQELVDLVTYLQTEYKVKYPENTYPY